MTRLVGLDCSQLNTKKQKNKSQCLVSPEQHCAVGSIAEPLPLPNLLEAFLSVHWETPFAQRRLLLLLRKVWKRGGLPDVCDKTVALFSLFFVRGEGLSAEKNMCKRLMSFAWRIVCFLHMAFAFYVSTSTGFFVFYSFHG